MVSTIIEFYALLERYADDPATCSKILRTFALADPANFLNFFLEAVVEYPVSRVTKFLAGLSIPAGIVKYLIELFGRDRNKALALAKKVAQSEPRLDLAVAEYLPEMINGVANPDITVQTALDILESVAEGDRLVPQVLKLLKHSNPKIRSKAALFVGSRTQNVRWATSRTNDADGRVRANMVESLYGLNSETVLQIYRNHVHDENNRAAGNAILGLYQLGDPASIPFIHEIARHADARFRNTGAWLIGRTADVRFSPLLAELLQDSDQLVRSQGFKALADIKRAARAERPALHVGMLKVRTEGSSKELVTSVCDESWQPVRRIPPTSFIAHAGGMAQAVQHFNVTEVDCRYSLSVAFVMCLPDAEPATFDAACRGAVERCSPLRRPKDRWTVAKLMGRFFPRAGSQSSEGRRSRQQFGILNVGDVTAPAAAPRCPEFDYSAAPEKAASMLQQDAVNVNVEEAELKTILGPLLRIDPSCVKTHLIFMGAGPQQDVLRTLATRMIGSSVVLHVVAASAEWATPEMQQLAESTGGCLLKVTAEMTLETACLFLYSSLLHQYRVSWTDDLVPTHLDVQGTQGRGSAVYSIADAVDLESEPILVGSV